MRAVAWLLAPSLLVHSVACGGTTSQNALYLATPGADASSATPGADATTAMPAIDATTGGCVGGTWALSETAGACGTCPNISDRVAIEVTDQMAAEGGAVSDSEGNTWTFDPATCTATLTGDCDASDTVFFAAGTASCSWTCGSFCPPCAATCVLTQFQ